VKVPVSGDSSFWFTRLAPRNQFGATVISMASLAERVALRVLGESDEGRSFRSWETPDGVLAFIGRRTPGAKTGWFDPRAATALKSSAKLSIPSFNQAVADVLGRYLRFDGPLARCAALAGDSSTPDQTFIRRAHTVFGDHARGSERLCALLDKLVANDLLKRLKDDLVQDIVAELLPGPQPPHPLLPSRSLFEPLMVQAEFLPVRSDPTPDAFANSCDLYAVIREARGWTPTDSADTNLLVRDLLWIRDTDAPQSTLDMRDGKDGTKLVGIYFSAVDRCCFYVERLVKQGGNVIITARTMHDASYTQYLTLIFASRPSRQPLVVRDGIVSGSAGDSATLAAWKCLIVRPDWPFFYHLRTVLHEATLGGVHQQNPYSLCAELRALGVIHSKALVSKHSSLGQRRNAFRHLLLHGTNHPGPSRDRFSANIQQEIEGALHGRFDDHDQVQELLSTVLDNPKQTTELVASILKEVAVNNWHLIEPAQIVSYPRTNSTSERDRVQNLKQVRLLLELNHTVEYQRE
jgi:hypothetical protein